MSARRTPPNPRRARGRRGGSSRPRWLPSPWLLVVVLCLAGVGFLGYRVLGGSRPNDLPSGAAWSSVQSAVANVGGDVFDAVGTGDLADPLQTMNSSQPLGGADGKPELLYIGAEYCSPCAAQRWSLILALSRFGEFANLQPTKSAAGESYSELPSFTFYRSQYNSPYLDFVALEIGNRSKQPLQHLSQDQQALFTLYDRPGTIPFLDFGNKYYTVNSGYDMTMLSNKDWQDLASNLNDPTNGVTKAIVGNANYLTAGVCLLTQNQPESVCGSTAVAAISSKLTSSR